ncbi:tripartite tricarboxylate transporter substrate binding protein [Candidatus Poribacteria bacterium]
MKGIVALVLVLMLVVSVSSCERKEKKFPERDVTNVVVWGAGGGTDICNRIVSAEMAKILGTNINVINKTGGVGGSVGMLYGYSQKHDGYTLTGLSESVVTAAVQGGWDKKMEVWNFFILGGSPDIISVTPDAPYSTIKDLIEAAKTSPESIKAGASAAGSIHHLNLLALESGSGAEFNFIPYSGSAPTQTAAMTGEISVVVTSLAEQQQLIRSKKLKPLGMLIPDSFEVDGVGAIPSVFDVYPDLSKYLPISQAIGMAMPADVPDAAKQVLIDAFEKALATDKVKTWAKENYYVLSGKTGVEATEEFNRLESLFSWTLWELGAAKVDPATLGIAKP